MAAPPPLPRPDALPVRPLGSRAVLPPDTAAALFGGALRGAERLEVVRLGSIVATVPVVAGAALRLVLDASVVAEPTMLRLKGPVGVVDAPRPEAVEARLVLPAGLARAWGVGESAVVALGSVAVKVRLEAGTEAGVEVDRALWAAAGRPEAARWLPQTDWTTDDMSASEVETADAAFVVPRRVVTETDVRQARLKRRTIRLAPGQVVTPAAQSLAREWGVFETTEAVAGAPR